MEYPEEMREQIQELAEIVRHACEHMAEALHKIVALYADSLRQALEELAAETTPPEKPQKKPPRPPRYDGPQNKGRAWNRKPSRLARSNCRKMRR